MPNPHKILSESLTVTYALGGVGWWKEETVFRIGIESSECERCH